MNSRQAAIVSWAILISFLLGGCGQLTGPTVEAQVSPELLKRASMTIAVLPFEQGEPPPSHQETFWMQVFTKDAGNLVSDMFTTELMRVPRFKLVERSQIKHVLNEQDLSLSQLLAKKSAQEIGHLLGVDAVVVGTVGEMASGTTCVPGTASCHYSYSMRMVDTHAGTVLVSASVSQDVGGDMDVSKRCQESVRALVDRIIEKTK